MPIADLIHKDNYYMDHEGRQQLKEDTQKEAETQEKNTQSENKSNNN